MRYEVICRFEDLQDNAYSYNVGDIFPHDELAVTEERIKELSSDRNRQRKPLIKPVEDTPLPFSGDTTFEEKPEEEINKQQKEKHYTKSEINRMNTADLQELAFNNGFENAYDMTGGELKKILAEYFGL